MPTRTPEAERQRIIEDVVRLLERHRVLDDLARRQITGNRQIIEDLQHRQNVADIQRRVSRLHPADLAFVLESLPWDDRHILWHDIDDAHAAEVLVELDESVRSALIASTPARRLAAILEHLDVDDLGWIADSVPTPVMEKVTRALGDLDRTLLGQSAAYSDGSVGQLMVHDVVAVQDTQTVTEALTTLRQRRTLPPNTDPLFVVDRRNVLRGALGLQTLLLADPSMSITDLMDPAVVSFSPDDAAVLAAKAFERYNLLSAPVVSDRGKLVGRLTVDAIMDFVKREADRGALAMAGLRDGEDLFAPVWHSARNRSTWLFVNLVTAFLATRFIGLFESTITELVALATLMPIVASVGGNTGNQTIALVIRGLAFDQINDGNVRHVLRKELIVGAVNGLMWGAFVGLMAIALYRHLWLGVVLMAAVLMNLIIAAVVGVVVPVILQRFGRDPAQGASVLLTFVTDSMGFLLFLGLAKLLL